MAKKNNKSLFLYTALIFIVAILLILLSFFGQKNLQSKQPKVDEGAIREQEGIAERASLLSDENKSLIEQNNALKAENKILLEYQTNNNILLSANGYLLSGDNSKALEMLQSVEFEKLNYDQQVLYNDISKKIE